MMKIIKILKNIFKETEEKEQEKHKVNLSDLDVFLDKNKEKIKEKEQEVLNRLNIIIDSFSKEVKEKVEIAEKVEIESKDKNNKIKAVVYEGRKKYIEFIERLIENLEEHKKIKDFGKSIENINLSFSKFNENSVKSYERATILIGKEMGTIKESLRKFSNETLELFNENKNLITEYKKISSVELRLKENKEIQEKYLKMEKEIKDLERKTKEKEKELDEKYETLNKIKNSNEYLENIKLKEEINLKEEKIKEEIYELRQKIDFKSLSGFFHIFPDKMNSIKEHKDNFFQEFRRNHGKPLISLINEAGLNNDDISEKIKEILNKENSLEKEKKEVKEDSTIQILSEIEILKENIKNWNNEEEWIKKRKEKLKEDEKKNIEKSKEELNEMNIEIV